jgi:hypothetical protein
MRCLVCIWELSLALKVFDQAVGDREGLDLILHLVDGAVIVLQSRSRVRRRPQPALGAVRFMPSRALVTLQRRASSNRARVPPVAAAAMVRNLAKILMFRRMTMKPMVRMTV